MTEHDFAATRLFVDAPLAAGAAVPLDRAQSNYLLNVLRKAPGDFVLVFNGRDGEWLAVLEPAGRRDAVLRVDTQTRPQPEAPDLHYLFAPLKQARLDYMVQKAVEMGAGRLRPALTQHTQIHRLNLDRMRANAVEAAEQCGILSIPEIDEPRPLAAILDSWDPARRLIFCDEAADKADPVAALAGVPKGPLAVLVGPEGGFSAAERADLRARPFVTVIPLGPRILRADTAAVAALALVQSVLGDWRK
ncbi:MAG: 16S rRNA (uracil(1498)-N(3))-methyltransferase [Bauldia sp.]|nr:16S rRNA (uracil(1498)-N(3))-methyltransferase [Bauldia sp.]